MSNFALPNDVSASIPLVFTDQIGRSVVVSAGLTATSSDATIGTAEIVTPIAPATGGPSLVIKPVGASGDFNVTLADGDLTASLPVSIVTPAATAIKIDLANATFAAIPAAPTDPAATDPAAPVAAAQ